jgi:hypothetical protein
MNNETNNEKIILSHKKGLKIHLSLKDKTWRNGIVIDIKPDFFMFLDEVSGEEPIFFLELHNVEPYTEDKNDK